MPLSAEFSVDSDSAVSAIEVAYGATVDLALLSDSGVNVVEWTIAGTSHASFSAPTITPAGSPSGKTASFAMPSDPGGGEGRSVLVKCVVTDSALNRAVAYRVVGVPNDVGTVPIAAGEENHRSATHGWIEPVNAALAGITPGSGPGSLPLEAAHGDTIATGEINAGGSDAELITWGVDDVDILSLGDNALVAGQQFRIAAGGNFGFYVDDVNVANINATQLELEGLDLRLTTGNAQFGTTVASTGDIRVGASWSLIGLNETLSADRAILTYGTGTVTLGGTTADTSIVRGTTSAIVNVNGTAMLSFDSTSANFGSTIVKVGSSVAASGTIRGGTALSVVALSGANDMDLIKASSGNIIIGEATHAGTVELQAATSIIHEVGGTDRVTLTTSAWTNTLPLEIGASGGAYATVGHIRVGTLSSDTTIMAWRVAGSDRAVLAYTNSGTLVQIGSNSLDTVFRSEARWRGRVSTSTDVIDVTSDGSVFRLRAPVVTNGSTGDCSVRATGSNGSNNSGAPLLLEGGRRAGSGTPGGVVLRGNVDDSTFHEGFKVGSSGSAAQITFFGGSLATKQTVTGAKGSNAALGSLLTALAAYGLITDSSSA